MLTGRDVVLISSIDWNDVWQVPQEIALRLGRAGNRVLFVENTGVRTPSISDSHRIKIRLRRWLGARPTKGLRRSAENVFVHSPLVLPPFGPAWRRWINRCFLLPRIARAAWRIGMRDPLLWTFLPTDSALEVTRLLRTRRGVVVYYCAADFTRLTPFAESMAQSEKRILEMCSVVFATCSELERHCAAWNKNVHICAHGVDIPAFPLDPAKEPERERKDCIRMLERVPRPVIGFIGGLHRFVDYALLEEMARARPGWTWVFVGPGASATPALAGLPNVRLIGQQPHEDMVHYVRLFDVGIVPYLKNIYTSTILPVKINEYLAVGKPVVSTDLQPVLEFNEIHRVLSTSDNRPGPFLEAIERALRDADDAGAAARRRETACRHDWKICMETMSGFISPHL